MQYLKKCNNINNATNAGFTKTASCPQAVMSEVLNLLASRKELQNSSTNANKSLMGDHLHV